MGIYSKKRKKSGVRILFFSLFFLSIFLFFGYYFFYPNNFKIILNEYPQVKSIEPQEVVEELGVTDKTGDYQSEIEIDLSNCAEHTKNKTKQWGEPLLSIPPHTGQLVIFPSYVYHQVKPVKNNIGRYCIAGNVAHDFDASTMVNV